MFKTHPPLEERIRRLRELGAGRNGVARQSTSSPGSSENITESRTPVRVAEVRAEDALALEADLLRAALRGDVVRVGDQLEPLELELVEAPAREQPERSGAQAPPSCGRCDPVADPTTVAVRVHAHPDRADDARPRA